MEPRHPRRLEKNRNNFHSLLRPASSPRQVTSSQGKPVIAIPAERGLDAELSLINQHRADAGLGWLITRLEAMRGSLRAAYCDIDRPGYHRRGPARADPVDPTLGVHEMVRVTPENRPLTATAPLALSGELPRALHQIVFETADGVDGGVRPVMSGASWCGPRRRRE